MRKFLSANGFGSIVATNAQLAVLCGLGQDRKHMSPQNFSTLMNCKTPLHISSESVAMGMAMLHESIKLFPWDPLCLVSTAVMEELADKITKHSTITGNRQQTYRSIINR